MNNIIVITGGSGGVGKYVIKKFLNIEDKVINIDINPLRDKSILNNANYFYIKADVTNVFDLERALEVIDKEFGSVEHIISMAGINMKSEIGGLETATIEDIDHSIKLNLNSHIYFVKLFLELLKKSNLEDKTITLISSINAIGDYGLPAYSAAKAGLYGFMKSMVRPIGSYGIRINTISLGTVPHNDDNIEGKEYFESKMNKLARGEFIKPKDVAEALYALIYITKGIIGQNIILDNGQSV